MKARDRGVKETVILFGMMFVFSGVGCGGGGKSGVDAVSRDVPKEIEIVHPDAGGEDINVATDNREIEYHDVKPDVSDVSDTADTVDVEDTIRDMQASQDEDSQTVDSKDSQAVDSREVETKDTSTVNKYYLTVGHDDTAQHYGYHRTHGYGQLQPNVYDGHDIDAIIVNHDSDGVYFYFTPLSQYNDFTKITIDFEGFGPAEFLWKFYGYPSYANKNSALTSFFYEHDGKTIVIDSITPSYQGVNEPDATEVTEGDVHNLDAVDGQAGVDANQTQDNGDAGTDAGSITHKTNWGFQPFPIPSDSITVPAGGNIQAAIDSLHNGGTVYLKAGKYTVDMLRLRNNLVIQGAGVGKTIISSGGAHDSPLMQAKGKEDYNIILRDFTADCKNVDTTANGIEFVYGFGGNLLVENLEIYGAAKSNLIIYNTSWSAPSKRITWRNINSYNAGIHGLAMRYVEGGVVDNCTSHNNTGFGIDCSRTLWGEISNFTGNTNGYGGIKLASSKYIYIHDSTLANGGTAGIFIMKGTDPYKGNQLQYLHIENTTIDNCSRAVHEFSDVNNPTIPPSFQEITLYGVVAIHNAKENKVALRGCNYAYEFGDDIGMTVAVDGTINSVPYPTGTPDSVGVGWKTWPSFPY